MAMPMTAVRSQNQGQCRVKELRAYPVVRYVTSPGYRAAPGFRKRKTDPLSNTADAVRRPMSC